MCDDFRLATFSAILHTEAAAKVVLYYSGDYSFGQHQAKFL